MLPLILLLQVYEQPYPVPAPGQQGPYQQGPYQQGPYQQPQGPYQQPGMPGGNPITGEQNPVQAAMDCTLRQSYALENTPAPAEQLAAQITDQCIRLFRVSDVQAMHFMRNNLYQVAYSTISQDRQYRGMLGH